RLGVAAGAEGALVQALDRHRVVGRFRPDGQGEVGHLRPSALSIWRAQRPLPGTQPGAGRGRGESLHADDEIGYGRANRDVRHGSSGRRRLAGRAARRAHAGGRFVRPTTRFRNWVTEDGGPGPTGEGGFAAAPGRYHLYVALPCPGAHRRVIMRMLKGLEDVVSMSVLEPLYGPHGWRFGTSPGTSPDSVNGASELAEIYLRADPRYTGRVSVPAFWDTVRRTIVNNERAEIN